MKEKQRTKKEGGKKGKDKKKEESKKKTVKYKTTFGSASVDEPLLTALQVGPPTASPLLGTGVPWVSLPGPTSVMTHPVIQAG